MDRPEHSPDVSRRAALRTGAAVGIGALSVGATGITSAGSAAATPVHGGAPDTWKGPGDRIVFEQRDFEVLDIVLHVVSDLRISALAVKLARRGGVRYPITDVATIVDLLPRRRFVAAGHDITEAAIRTYLPAELLPIHHEGELAERVYIALLRCRAESSSSAAAGKLR